MRIVKGRKMRVAGRLARKEVEEKLIRVIGGKARGKEIERKIMK
jgi:hypothetical protein